MTKWKLLEEDYISFHEPVYMSEDEIVSVYQRIDGSWTVTWSPFIHKNINLTREQAFAFAEEKHAEISRSRLGAEVL